ncbi:hypothetical protein MMC22_009884 [Lobaria immixta]|nr:hypothetical protein [Lobaria immixta]
MSASTAESLWNPAEIGYFDPSRSGNAIGDVYQFIDRFTTVAFATNFEEVQANLHTCLLGPAGEWYKVLLDYHKKMLCYNDKAKNWIAALIERFDTEYRNKDYYHCSNKATHICQQLERKYIEDHQRAQHEQRQHDNERREQQRLERVKRFEAQENARQQYEMVQQRIREEQEMEPQKRLDEQEIERQIAEQKAKDEAFACRRCPEKFSSNTKLHKHIAAHHITPARASSAALAPAQAMAISSSALPTPTPPTTSSAPPTPPASTHSATPKLSYAAIAGSRAPFTPPTTPRITKHVSSIPIAKATFSALLTPTTPTLPTTPKIAKSTCTMPKPATYMTIEDLFRKFAPRNTEPPHQHAADRPQSLQMPLPILRQKATVSRSLATISAFNKCARSTKSVPSSISTRFTVAYHAIPTWE